MPSSIRDDSRKWLLMLTAVGIVFGDIGTSPLYALRECFHGLHAIPLSTENLLGVLSLIFWSFMIVISLKYLQFIMYAHNRGEGGGLALTALATMHRKRRLQIGNKFFLLLGLFGAALLVGDGIITPAISVLSAIEGLKVATPVFEPFILPLTMITLVGLFLIQKHGTHRIGSFFGPVMVLWFGTLGALGAFSIWKYPAILLSVNPFYGAQFLYANPTLGFLSLGSVFLAVTGGEALYADLGHFGRAAITRAWYFVALPGLMLNYWGQGALLILQPEAIENPFYNLAPEMLLYPLVFLSTAATVIASQALISGLYSLARQCIQLGYCPRLNIVHTSSDEIGQIYAPSVNWFLLAGTLWVVFEFKSSSALASAYGLSVSLTMTISTILAAVVARIHWRFSYFRLALLLALFLTVDLAFLGANLMKVADGGWVPLTIAGCVFALMLTWNSGRKLLVAKLRAKSYPFDQLLADLKARPPARVPGCAVFMVGDVNTTPPPLMHNLKHNKVLHEQVIFLTVITHEVSRVPESEQLEIRPMAEGFYQLIGHYGFMQSPNVMKLLDSAQKQMPEFKLLEPTFFLGREVLVSSQGNWLTQMRNRLFYFLSRNSRTATSYFHLPTDRVIEVGMQVEL